jgi:hypothetical protein
MMSKVFSIFLALLVWAGAALAKEPRVLPRTFNGWQLNSASVKAGSDPAGVDPADAPVLKEYGFSGFELASYTRYGRTMQVKAARFNDASGAYGAFTYYLQPQMQKESIGDQGASNNRRVLFYRGNILVDASLEQLTAMSAEDLRALSATLPKPTASISALPTLPGELPKQSMVPETARYIMGPVALDRLGVPLPSGLIDFSMSPEVEFAQYRSSNGEAGLTLISYPTPQIAAEKVKAMQSAGLPGMFYFRRSGPLVAAVSGSIPQSEAESLLASVNYDADVTWNQATKPNPKDDPYSLVLSLVLLIAFVLGVALIFGFAFGGVRLAAKKLFPNRVFDRPEDVEIIRLNLK